MILLDTCTLLWLALEPDHLSPRARDVLTATPDTVFVSVVTAFEIGQKHAKGKLELKHPPMRWVPLAIKHHHLQTLALDLPVALRAAALPPLHNDPFDRLLIATAQEHHLTLFTPDPKIRAYPDLKTLW